MTIARVKPGNWSANEELTSAQMNQIDTNITYGLDNRAGQTATLSSNVTVDAGASLVFDPAAEIDGEAHLVSGAQLVLDSGSSLSGSPEATLTLVSGSSVEFNTGADIILGGAVTITGDPDISGDITRSGRETLSGADARTVRRIDTSTLGDADDTVDVSKDIWMIEATLTAQHTYTLRSSTSPTPVAGEEITITSAGLGAFGRLIKRESAATVVSLPGSAWSSCTVFFDGTNWRLKTHANGTPGAAA